MIIERAHGVEAETAERDGTLECLTIAQRDFPEDGQGHIEVAGGAATFFGRSSPMNEAVRIGLDGAVTDGDIERITDFYRERAVPARVVASALADATLARRLVAHGYEPVDVTNLLVGELREMDGTYDPRIRAPVARHAWGRAAAEAYASGAPVASDGFIVGETIASAPSCIPLEAVIDGRIAAVGVAGTNAAMAGMFFGATMPWARGRGLQLAMIRHRVRLLQEAGARYVRAAATPASSSERNLRRAGMQVAYSRTLWERQ